MLTMTELYLEPKDIPGLPDGVETWNINTGSDATGEPAVWVWVKIKDEILDRMNGTKREEIRDLISAAIQKKMIGQYGTSIPWVYVRFLGSSEVK